MGISQYPLKMEEVQREKLQRLADKERRSLNQTILLAIDKFLNERKNGN